MHGWGIFIWENSMVAVVFCLVILFVRGLTKNYSKIYVKVLWIALFAELLLPAGFYSPFLSVRAVVSEAAGEILQAEATTGESSEPVYIVPEQVIQQGETVGQTQQGETAVPQKIEEIGTTSHAGSESAAGNQSIVPESAESTHGAGTISGLESEAIPEESDIWQRIAGAIFRLNAVWQAFLSIAKQQFVRIWAIGAAAVGLYYLISFLRLKRSLRLATKREKHIWESDTVRMPFVMPGIRSRIYIPYDLSEEQRELILEHERQHIKNGDPWMKCIAAAATVLHWFNPVVWLAFWLFGKDMELYCDERIMKQKKLVKRKEYAQVLLEFSMKNNSLLPLVSFGESDTHARVRHVLYRKKMRPFLALLLSVCLVLCCTVFLGAGRAEEGAGVIIEEITEMKEPETAARTESVTESETQEAEMITEEQPVVDIAGSLPVAENEYLLLQCGDSIQISDRSGQVIRTLPQAKICGEQLPEDVKSPFVNAYLADRQDVLPLAVYTGRTDSIEGYEVGMFSLESMNWIMEPSYRWLTRLSDTLCTDFTRTAEYGNLMTLSGEVIREQGSFQSYGEYIWDGMSEKMYDQSGAVLLEKLNDSTWTAQTAEGSEEITGADLHLCSVIGSVVTWCSEEKHFVTSLAQRMYVTDQMFYERNPQLQIPGGHIQVISGREDGSELLVYLYSEGYENYYLCDSELHILEDLGKRIPDPTHLSRSAEKKTELLAHPWTWSLNDDYTIRVEEIWGGQVFVPEKVRCPEKLTRAGEITCISSNGLSDFFYREQEILALAQGARLISKRNHLAVAEGGRETWYITPAFSFEGGSLNQSEASSAGEM